MQLCICYCVFIFNGMLALSIGSLLPFIREARGLDYTLSGILVSLHSVGNLISSFFAGAFAVKLGRKKSILMFNACYAIIPVKDFAVGKSKKVGANYGFFKEPLFYLVIVSLFFYLCAEQGVIGWLVTYFKDTGLLEGGVSQMMASIQWIMILAGRLTTVWLSTKVKKENFLPFMGAGLVVFFILLIFSRTTALIVLGIMGFGFSMAGIYPTIVSCAGNMIQKYPLAWSFILTSASIGSIAMPAIIGKIAETAGIYSGMSSVAVVVIIDFICILALVTYMKRAKKEQ